jgi:hypothetical protein
MAFLIEIEFIMRRQIVIRRQQKAASAARWIADNFVRTRRDAVNERVDEHARCEVLSRSALGVFGVLFEQAFVGVALHIGRHRGPAFLADQLDDQLAELAGS